jgi:hypothetical protein
MLQQDHKDVLDPAVEELLLTLREMESDFPEISTEESLSYILAQVFDVVYSERGYKPLNDGLGMLEFVKQQFYRQHFGKY